MSDRCVVCGSRFIVHGSWFKVQGSTIPLPYICSLKKNVLYCLSSLVITNSIISRTSFKTNMILLLLLILCGCTTTTTDSGSTGNWVFFRGDAAMSGYTNVRLPENPAIQWIYKSDLRTFSSPLVYHGTVFWSDRRGRIQGVDS